MPTAMKRRALDHNAPSGLTFRATYKTALGNRLQSVVFNAFFARKSSDSKRAATFEEFEEQPASFRRRA